MRSHLDRKLLRDLSRMKGQAIAVALVMACGLAMLTMSRSLINSLESTRREFHRGAYRGNSRYRPGASRNRRAGHSGYRGFGRAGERHGVVTPRFWRTGVESAVPSRRQLADAR